MHPYSGSVFSSSNCPCSDAKHLLTASSLILPTTLKLVFKFIHRNEDSGPHSCGMAQSDFELDPWILYPHPPPPYALPSTEARGKLEPVPSPQKEWLCLLEGLWSSGGGAKENWRLQTWTAVNATLAIATPFDQPVDPDQSLRRW